MQIDQAREQILSMKIQDKRIFGDVFNSLGNCDDSLVPDQYLANPDYLARLYIDHIDILEQRFGWKFLRRALQAIAAKNDDDRQSKYRLSDSNGDLNSKRHGFTFFKQLVKNPARVGWARRIKQMEIQPMAAWIRVASSIRL